MTDVSTLGSGMSCLWLEVDLESLLRAKGHDPEIMKLGDVP